MGEVGNVVSIMKTHVKVELTQGGVPRAIKTWKYNNVMPFRVRYIVYQKILEEEETAHKKKKRKTSHKTDKLGKMKSRLSVLFLEIKNLSNQDAPIAGEVSQRRKHQ